MADLIVAQFGVVGIGLLGGFMVGFGYGVLRGHSQFRTELADVRTLNESARILNDQAVVALDEALAQLDRVKTFAGEQP